MCTSRYESDSAVEFHTDLRNPGGEPSILELKPCFRNVHVTDDAVAFCSTMPVGAAARNQIEFGRKSLEPNCVSRRVARVPDLYPVETVASQSCETLASAVAPRVGPDREGSSTVRNSNGVGYIEPRLGNVRGLPCSEEPIEYIAVVARETGANENSRDMRPAKRPTPRFGKDIFERYRKPQFGEPFDNAASALDAFVLEAFERRSDGVGIADVQCEKMDLEVTIVGAELATAHDANAESHSSRYGLVVSGDGIMIGYRDRLQFRTHGGLNELGRRDRAIGRGRVRMKIDVTLSCRPLVVLTHRA